MYDTDRGIEELDRRRGEETVTLSWLAEELRTFVDLHPEFETPVDRLATWLARPDDDDAEPTSGVALFAVGVVQVYRGAGTKAYRVVDEFNAARCVPGAGQARQELRRRATNPGQVVRTITAQRRRPGWCSAGSRRRRSWPRSA